MVVAKKLAEQGHGHLKTGATVTAESELWARQAYAVIRQVADEANMFPSETTLSETKHPYYSSETPYFNREREYPQRFNSWQSFRESGWHDSDEDMNYLVRWDWLSPDPDDYEGTGEPVPDHDTLWLFFVLQRKGLYAPLAVAVRKEDEPEVRAWLKTRWRTVQANWTPIR